MFVSHVKIVCYKTLSLVLYNFMINSVKKMQNFSFLIYVSPIIIMYFIKIGAEKMRKMRVFESFFSLSDKIIVIIFM
jgi:hypothetical protein